ncbi:DNA polymerase beta superfamily protein [Haloarchaeobius sp. HRN-SO-5]|uniref:DNA polymerase beta superfamily protein n=1 Tax=Haloarchaeobius sp. HRN-SO-5 TaxID=3446118 RepID=UPI003EBDDEB9
MTDDAPDGGVAAEPPALADAVDAVEAEYDCTVLAARDVGSRAWDLDDAGSDYDVAVLFRQPLLRYATLGEYVPTVETELDDVELTGWNVRRFAELLADSNPTTLEFLHSPRRYRAFDPLAALEADVGGQFEPIRLYHHYRSLAERQYRKYLERRLLAAGEPAFVVVDETADHWVCVPSDGGTGLGRQLAGAELRTISKDDDRYELGRCDRTVRRTLYVVRAVLYARYVRDTHSFPTLSFPTFLDECEAAGRVDPSVLDRVRTLVRRKRAGEGDAVVGSTFSGEELALPSDVSPEAHAVRGIDTDRVNEFVEAAFENGSSPVAR